MNLPTTWMTKEKQTLNIREMTTQHIKNTLALLRRKGFLTPEEAEWEAARCCGFSGEMSSYYAEQEMDAAFNKSCPHILAFEEELQRRGEGC